MVYEKSFTLIEILMVLTIISLFTGYSLATYNSFSQKKTLEKEASFLGDILSLAMGKAQGADISLSCSGSDEFGGYRVEVNASNYSFRQCCRNVYTKVISSCGSNIQSYNFHNSVSKISGASIIDFYPLTNGATPTTITLKHTSLSKCLDVSITAAGIITVGDIPVLC